MNISERLREIRERHSLFEPVTGSALKLGEGVLSNVEYRLPDVIYDFQGVAGTMQDLGVTYDQARWFERGEKVSGSYQVIPLRWSSQ